MFSKFEFEFFACIIAFFILFAPDTEGIQTLFFFIIYILLISLYLFSLHFSFLSLSIIIIYLSALTILFAFLIMLFPFSTPSLRWGK